MNLQDLVDEWKAMADLVITTRRFPSIVGIAMEIAPLVRLGFLTDSEGSWLVRHRYRIRQIELEHEDKAA